MRHVKFATLVGALLALWTGCVMSPRPEPPAEAASTGRSDGDSSGNQKGEPAMDLARVWIEPCAACVLSHRVRGQAGAVAPVEGGAVVWVVNVDGQRGATQVSVAADGSFVAEVQAATGDELRLQVRSPVRRRSPADVLVPETLAHPVPAPRALGSCLVLQPAYEAELAPGASVRVSNACGVPIEVARAQMRVEVPELLVSGPAAPPWTLAAYASAQVTVELRPGFSSAPEELLLVETSSPARDRRPVTVYSSPGP